MPELQGQSERLPCGCVIANRIVDGDRQFVCEPCSLDCEYFRYMIEESERRGNPVEYRNGQLKGEPKDV